VVAKDVAGALHFQQSGFRSNQRAAPASGGEAGSYCSQPSRARHVRCLGRSYNASRAGAAWKSVMIGDDMLVAFVSEIRAQAARDRDKEAAYQTLLNAQAGKAWAHGNSWPNGGARRNARRDGSARRGLRKGHVNLPRCPAWRQRVKIAARVMEQQKDEERDGARSMVARRRRVVGSART
jgi:hypothetical protein